jgi:hypothetical protein
MQADTAEHADGQLGSSTRARERRLLLACALAGAVAALGLVALVLALISRPADGTTAPAVQQSTGFILFDEFHVTLFVTPGATGENTIELDLATHDGSGAPDVSAVTVTTVGPLGEEPAEYAAVPVAGSPGTYRVTDVSFPSAGDWQLGVSARVAGSEPAEDTTVVSIGAP